jgi:hypothetical protein
METLKVGEEVEGREVAQTMYTHVSKCKNDKIKNKRLVEWHKH